MFRSTAKSLALSMPAIRRVIRQRDALLDEVSHLRRRVKALERAGAGRSKQPHFVEAYMDLVSDLVATHPLDEAMSLAVGGDYDTIGNRSARLLLSCGLSERDRLVDLGCGSGRLAKHIGLALPKIDYVGIDIVQDLLDYAAKKAPPHFRFILHREISLPLPDESADFVVGFSVFTHLYHEESYSYLLECRRVLRTGGKVVLSFLESKEHWLVFESMLGNIPHSPRGPLIMFMERPLVVTWAEHLEMQLEAFNPGPPFGQTVAVLRKL